MLYDTRALDRVPVEGFSVDVHAAVGFVECPVVPRSHNDPAITSKSSHIYQSINDYRGAGIKAGRLICEVAGVKKVPLPVLVPKGKGVDCKSVLIAIRELVLSIRIRTLR